LYSLTTTLIGNGTERQRGAERQKGREAWEEKVKDFKPEYRPRHMLSELTMAE
jgi:hypothetical protein